MPGAPHSRGTADGGPLKGGAPRVVWQTLGADPRIVAAASAAQRLDRIGRPCHLVWNPLRGEIVQMIPILRAGRLLGWTEGLYQRIPARTGPIAKANAEGRLCVQVGVVAFAWQPFTLWPMIGLPRIMGWLDSWGIPRQWPAGLPVPFPDGLTTPGDRRLWARGGHYGASQVPGLPAAGPGAIDIDQIRRAGLPENPGTRTSPVPVASGCGGRRASAGELPDLDRYVGSGAHAAGALSRVG